MSNKKNSFLFPSLVLGFCTLAICFWYSQKNSNRTGLEALVEKTEKNKDKIQANKSFDKNNGNWEDDEELEEDWEDEDEEGIEENEEEIEYDDRGAAEVYSTSEQALNAVTKGLKYLDTNIIEQFRDLPKSCTWSDEFLTKIKEKLKDEKNSEDLWYYSELLTVTGRKDAVEEVIANFPKHKDDEEMVTSLSIALENTSVNSETFPLLVSQMDSDIEQERDGAIRAIAYSGTKEAIDTLYQDIVSKKDVTGDKSAGYIFDEIFVEGEGLNVLKDYALKEDQYSHFAVKGLLSSGREGVEVLVDTLNQAKNPVMFENALNENLSLLEWDEASRDYLQEQLNNKNSSKAVIDFATKAIDVINKSTEGSEEEIEDTTSEEDDED